MVRVIVFGFLAGLCVIPILTVKRDMVGDVGYMIVDFGIPMGLLGWLCQGGLYDLLVAKLESCGTKTAEEG